MKDCGLAKTLRTTLALGLMMHTTLACSLFGPRSQSMEFSLDPSGVAVYVDGMRVGVTPTTYRVSRKGDVSFLFKKDGCTSQVRQPMKSLSTLGFIDLVGGVLILLPLIGLASSAAWAWEPSSFAVILECDDI
jgi:hypothetical protein